MSKAGELAKLNNMMDVADDLATKSFENEEFILDVSFSEPEVFHAVKKLKSWT